MSAGHGLEELLARHRAWVVMGVLLVALIIVGVTGIGSQSTVGSASADRPQVSFGANVQAGPDASSLNYTNGWVATSGATVIGVYAGSQPEHRGNGLLVVLRRNDGHRSQRSLVLRGSGPVTLLRPTNVQTEGQAFAETLNFVTADGETGSLNLANDRASLVN